MLLENLRKQVWEANISLPASGLVTMHSGNASGRDFESNLIVIKPSGIDYNKLQPEDLVITDINGNIVEGKLKPSVDLPVHLFLYKNRPEWGGIIHTHSNYATSFAAIGEGIPVYLTAIADEFGARIPCTKYASNEDDNIGEAILRNLGRGPAILLKNHGVFTFGKNAKEALKAAIMVEDVAKTVHLALRIGIPDELPNEEIEKWWRRYHDRYGQNL
jgi:L-ribulose-5-phosphate 4-epimerase